MKTPTQRGAKSAKSLPFVSKWQTWGSQTPPTQDTDEAAKRIEADPFGTFGTSSDSVFVEKMADILPRISEQEHAEKFPEVPMQRGAKSAKRVGLDTFGTFGTSPSRAFVEKTPVLPPGDAPADLSPDLPPCAVCGQPDRWNDAGVWRCVSCETRPISDRLRELARRDGDPGPADWRDRYPPLGVPSTRWKACPYREGGGNE